MAKYDVTYACGHEGVEDIYGTNVNGEREKKVKWIEENRVCYDCYIKEQTADCDEVEMHYGEYKNNYADCKTKKGSYDKSNKTIIVYVPKAKEEKATSTNGKCPRCGTYCYGDCQAYNAE